MQTLQFDCTFHQIIFKITFGNENQFKYGTWRILFAFSNSDLERHFGRYSFDKVLNQRIPTHNIPEMAFNLLSTHSKTILTSQKETHRCTLKQPYPRSSEIL